jgi:hypothetical protein
MRRKHGLADKHPSLNQSKNFLPGQKLNNDINLIYSHYYTTPSMLNSGYQMDNPNRDPNDFIRGILDWMEPIVKFKKNLDFILGSTRSNCGFFPSQLPFGLPSQFDQFAGLLVPPETKIPFGFRTKLCRRCLQNISIEVHFDGEVNRHVCQAGKEDLGVAKKFSGPSAGVLFYTLSGLQKIRFDILHADSLSGDDLQGWEFIVSNPLNRNQKISLFSDYELNLSLDLDKLLCAIKRSSNRFWLKTLIEEGCIRLSQDELYSYLQWTKTATFAFIRVRYKGIIRSYFVNLVGQRL